MERTCSPRPEVFPLAMPGAPSSLFAPSRNALVAPSSVLGQVADLEPQTGAPLVEAAAAASLHFAGENALERALVGPNETGKHQASNCFCAHSTLSRL